jgi:membrane protein
LKADRLMQSAPVSFAKRVLKEVNTDDISGLSAELAYRFFLSLFPFFIFLAALGGFIADAIGTRNPTDEIMDLLGENVPADVASVLRGQIEEIIEAQNPGLVSIAIVGALWTAASGISGLIKGLNRIYGVKEGRPVWKRYLVSLGLTLLAGGALIVAFFLFIVGQVYGLEVAGELGLEGQAAQLITLARWPIVIIAVLAAVAFLYWAAPNAKLPFRWLTPGSVLFTAAWLLLNYLFGVYLSSFSSYNVTYGALAGVVIVLLWMYLTSFLLLLGAEINFVLIKEGEPVAPADTTTLRGETGLSRPQEQP